MKTYVFLQLVSSNWVKALDLRNSKKWQKIGVYCMCLQNDHNFEGLYLSHFWSELNKFGQGGPLDLSDSKNLQNFVAYRMYQQKGTILKVHI